MRQIPQHIWDVWNAGGAIVGANKAPHGRVTVETDWFLNPVQGDPVPWYAKEYDDSLWTPIGVITDVADAQINWPLLFGTRWAGDFPDDTASIGWLNNGTINDALSGGMHARWTYFNFASGSFTFYAACDDYCEVWIDGVSIGTVETFIGTTSFTVSMGMGTHVVAIKAINIEQTIMNNPGGVAWAIYQGGTFIAHSDDQGVMREHVQHVDRRTDILSQLADPEPQYVIGAYPKAPVRWWQNSENDQIETEVPNIENIQIDRSIDQDAATCKITLSNQWHLDNGVVVSGDPELGQPGYFSFSRGDSADALSRWDQVPNDWNNVLIPDALLRTYQGYGGKTKSIGDAEDDGNIVLTGVWLVDSIRIGTGGKVEISCRDMAKLLIEQQIYPPLVPSNLYPVTYSRWGFDDLSARTTALSVIASDPTVPGSLLMSSGCTNYLGAVNYPDFPDHEQNYPGNGYWLLVNDGRVYNFGNNRSFDTQISVGHVLTDYATNPAMKIESTVDDDGYWVLYNNGTVRNFGFAVDYGYALRDNSIGFARNYSGDGYWVMDVWGVVTNHGSATAHGNIPTAPDPTDFWGSTIATGLAGDPVGDGYWGLDNKGHVYAFGSAVFYGEPFGATLPGTSDPVGTFSGIFAHPNGKGYWVIDQIGDVHAFGSAAHYGQLAGQAYAALGGNLPFENPDFPDYMCGLIPTPSGKGYWLLGVSGGVYPFGDALFLGSLNAPYEANLRIDGNYSDYSEIIRDLALWAGFWLYPEMDGDNTPSVYGNIETTGAFASDRLDEGIFDKKPVIDPMTKLKEIVGYIIWVDDEGAFHFESPNIYSQGNFDEFGERIETIPEIDERIQLTDYTIEYADKSARSEIIISTTDPVNALDDTITTRFTPATSEILRGMIKPAMWVNGVFTIKAEQQIMAELISLYIWLAQRQGSVTCLANPAIQINDQVRIWERVTGETYIHYVRGVSSSMDLVQGTYMTTLTTHWMGDSSLWAIDLARVPHEFSTISSQVELTYNHATNDAFGVSGIPDYTYDGNLATAWRPTGGNGQVYTQAVEYIEYDLTGTISKVGLYAFGCTEAYISVMVGGVWQGGSTIPYTPVESGASVFFPADASINYVSHETSLTDEGETIITLPSTYNATKLRVTLAGFSTGDWGPFFYYGGLREVAAGV